MSLALSMTTRVACLAAATGVYLTYKYIQNVRTKRGTNNLVNQLKANPEVAEGFAETLDILVHKRTMTTVDLDKKFESLLNGTTNKLGTWLVKYIQKLNNGNYLFVTTVKTSELMPVGGGGVNAEEVHNLNFLLKENAGQYAVYSDLHATLVDKNLRQSFAEDVFNIIQL